MKLAWYVLLLALLLTALGCAGSRIGLPDSDGPPPGQDATAGYRFHAAAIVGYWSSRDDGLEVHITGLDLGRTGSGSFKDLEGHLVPAGKFRNIRYLGGNRWECEQFKHRTLTYPRDPNRIVWEFTVLELLSPNILQAGQTIYDRR